MSVAHRLPISHVQSLFRCRNAAPRSGPNTYLVISIFPNPQTGGGVRGRCLNMLATELIGWNVYSLGRSTTPRSLRIPPPKSTKNREDDDELGRRLEELTAQRIGGEKLAKVARVTEWGRKSGLGSQQGVESGGRQQPPPPTATPHEIC